MKKDTKRTVLLILSVLTLISTGRLALEHAIKETSRPQESAQERRAREREEALMRFLNAEEYHLKKAEDFGYNLGLFAMAMLALLYIGYFIKTRKPKKKDRKEDKGT